MNNNILGGRGQCKKCGKMENNVSYHEEHECGKGEWYYDELHETWSRIENGVRVWYEKKPDKL